MNLPHLLFLFPFAVAAACWLAAVVSVVRTAAPLRAVVWVALTLVFPFVGPVLWFAVGRTHERAVAADHAGPPAALLGH